MPRRCFSCEKNAVVAAKINDGTEVINAFLCESCLHAAAKLAQITVVASVHPSYPVGYTEGRIPAKDALDNYEFEEEPPKPPEQPELSESPVCRICGLPAVAEGEFAIRGKHTKCSLCRKCIDRLSVNPIVSGLKIDYYAKPEAPREIPPAPSEQTPQKTVSLKNKIILVFIAALFLFGGIGLFIGIFPGLLRSNTSPLTSDLQSEPEPEYPELDPAYVDSILADTESAVAFVRQNLKDKGFSNLDVSLISISQNKKSMRPNGEFSLYVLVTVPDGSLKTETIKNVRSACNSKNIIASEIYVVEGVQLTNQSGTKTVNYNQILGPDSPIIPPEPKTVSKSDPIYIPSELSDTLMSKMWDAAKEKVKNSLKSPSTAEFQKYWSDNVKFIKGTEDDVKTGGFNVSVFAYVDSQNSYGAEIRTYFLVYFMVDSSSTFKIVDVDFAEP